MLPTVPSQSYGTPKMRVASVDAYRGLVMFLMLAEVLGSCTVSAALPDSRLWRFVCHEQTHAAWVGCSLHDLIQPGFYFLVGVGLLFSMVRRLSSRQTFGAMARHAILRAFILIVLGMALASIHTRQWEWRFDDTLTQIGLAYPFLFLIVLRRKRDWYIALGAILVGYWLWFALSPDLPPTFDYAGVGVSPAWLNAHGLTGFGAHWQKNSNVACTFDLWFLNLFPRDAPYTCGAKGLTTLNFIPSIGTMILGLVAGDLLRSGQPSWNKLRWLCVAGLLLVCGGWLLGVLGVCPVVKAIWTPSWVLFSGGWCCLFLAGFYALVDLGVFKRAAFPLTVIGMNSIVAYSMSSIYTGVAFNGFRRIVGDSPFEVLGEAYEPIVYGSVVVLAYWLVLFFLYRQRLFVRI
jgi:heparan-alpha-glucosaminide N-acetyltransferase